MQMSNTTDADFMIIDISSLLDVDLTENDGTSEFLINVARSLYGAMLRAIVSNEALTNALNDEHADYDQQLDNIMDDIFLIATDEHVSTLSYDDIAPNLSLSLDRLQEWSFNNGTLS